MLRRALPTVSRLARTGVQQQPRALASDAVGPYGPNMPDATMDDMPVPCQPYKEVYDKLNAKWNLWLGISAGTLVAVFVGVVSTDAFHTSYGTPPASYVNKTQPPYAGPPKA